MSSAKLQLPCLGSSSALSLEGSSNRYLLGSSVPPVICQALDCGFGEGDDTPLQYSRLENPMDGGAWKAAVHGVAEGQTQLSDFTFTFHSHENGNGNPLQCFFLENPRDGGAWWLHRVGHD